MQISSSVSASPIHWNLNSFKDSANFLLALDKSEIGEEWVVYKYVIVKSYKVILTLYDLIFV